MALVSVHPRLQLWMSPLLFTGDADIFSDLSAPAAKEPQKPKIPTPRKGLYPPAPAGLFDDEDDNDDDDNDDFFATSSSKPPKTSTCLNFICWQRKYVDLEKMYILTCSSPCMFFQRYLIST